MNKLTMAVGSKRGPKMAAVTQALAEIAPLFGADVQFEVVGVEVESGVGHTPSSREELMRGARLRAEAVHRVARQNNERWDYFAGLEGGLDVVVLDAQERNSSKVAGDGGELSRRVFLESWAYITDGHTGHYGRSGGVEIPKALAHEVLENGVELSVAIDAFAGARGIRDSQGAWGVLTQNLITRQEAFRVAVVAAFAPFYGGEMYGRLRQSMNA
jgi:inosine/xanthosine triphosphatase